MFPTNTFKQLSTLNTINNQIKAKVENPQFKRG